MENIGQLDANQREMVIDQVMSLDDVTAIALEDLKWIVMMVLGNSGKADTATQWLESIVFLDESRVLQ